MRSVFSRVLSPSTSSAEGALRACPGWLTVRGRRREALGRVRRRAVSGRARGVRTRRRSERWLARTWAQPFRASAPARPARPRKKERPPAGRVQPQKVLVIEPSYALPGAPGSLLVGRRPDDLTGPM